MTDGIHLSIYPDLDPLAVARIVDGYGIEAAFERWAPWSKKSISEAANRGRKLLSNSPAESGATRQPERGAGGLDPAGDRRRIQFDGCELDPVFRPHGANRCPHHL